MNYRLSSASAAAVFIVIAALISGPAISGQPVVKSSKTASSDTTIEGALLVKEGHGEIIVRSEGGHQRRLKVKQSTVITRNGKPAMFHDLQVRDHVRVSYDAKRVAVELDATGS